MRADPAKWVLPADLVELQAERGLNVKKFAHPDGRTKTLIVGLTDMHFRDGDGSWRDLDEELRPDGTDHIQELAGVTVRATPRGIALIVRETGKGVLWRMPAPPEKVGKCAEYRGQGLVWEYQAVGQGLKMSATVAARRGKKTYRFTYEPLGGASNLHIDPEGALRNEDFVYPAPFLIGADGQRFDCGGWKLTGKTASFVVDDTAMPDNAIPYVIDPTGTWSAGSPTQPITNDGWVRAYTSDPAIMQPTAAQQFSDETYLRVGREKVATYEWQEWQSLIKFDGLEVIPDEATIASAFLRVKVQGVPTAATKLPLCLAYVSPSIWPLTVSDYDPAPVPNANTGVSWAHITTAGALLDCTLANPDANIPRSLPGNNSLALRLFMQLPADGSAPINQQLTMSAFNDTTAGNSPYLYITYTAPNTSDAIKFVGLISMRQNLDRLFRFKNGTLFTVIRHTDPPLQRYAVKVGEGVWTDAPIPGTASGPGYDSAMSISAQPGRTDDTAWMTYNLPGTGLVLVQLTGNPDGTISWGAPLTIEANTGSGMQNVQVVVDQYGHKHIFYGGIAGTTSGLRYRSVSPAGVVSARTDALNTTNSSVTYDATGFTFHYSKVNDRIVILYQRDTFLEFKVGTVPAGGGKVTTWSATITHGGTIANNNSDCAPADFGPDGLLYGYRKGTGGVHRAQWFVINPVAPGWTRSLTIIHDTAGAPYQYFGTDWCVPRTTADGNIFLFGPMWWGNVSTNNDRLPVGWIRWDGGAAQWSLPTYVTPANQPPNNPWRLNPMLVHRESHEADNWAWAMVEDLPGGNAQTGSANYFLTGITNPAPPSYSNTASPLRRWWGSFNASRSGNHGGGLDPF